MKRHVSIALAAALLLGGSAGSALAMWPFSSSTKVSPAVRDSLSLSTTEQKTVWKDINGQASSQNAPSGFQATVGSTVPSAVQIKSISGKAVKDTPAVKSYDFAVVSGKLLIVNPSDRKIAEVITG